MFIKKNNAAEQKKALDLKKKIEAAKDKVNEQSIHDKIKEVIDDEGSAAFKFIGSQRALAPKLKAIIKHLLVSDSRKHNKYCPCCRNYDEGDDPSEQ